MGLADSLGALKSERNGNRDDLSVSRFKFGYGVYKGYDPSTGYQVEVQGVTKYYNRVANIGAIPVGSQVRIFGDTLMNDQVSPVG